MNNAKYLFQNFIINYTKTGNYLIDYILNFSLLSIISYFCDKIRFINIDFSLFNRSKYSEIIIESKENSNNDKNSIKRTYYTKNFKAIIFYIKTIKPNGIYCKRESEKINEHDDMFDLFIPDQKEHFLLEDNIYCQIKMTKTVIDKNNGKDLSKLHTIKIFSYNKNITIIDIEDFIQKCVNNFNEYLSNKLFKNQYYFSYINREDNIPLFNEREFITNRTFNTIFFEEKEKYISHLKFFIENEDWYKKKGLPYHYGILLHGEPGCGKTSIIKATLKEIDRNAVSISLNGIETCAELENIFYNNEINDKYIPNNKRIYIFEDADCLYDIIKDRELEINNKNENNISSLDILSKIANLNETKTDENPNDKLTLSCLLNIIDGILEIPGRIIILTTNYVDKIDKALLRPGRIDCNICLKRANAQITKELLSFFYEIDILIIDNLCKNKLVDYILTPAQIMNICQLNINDIENAIKEIYNLSNINKDKYNYLSEEDKKIYMKQLPC